MKIYEWNIKSLFIGKLPAKKSRGNTLLSSSSESFESFDEFGDRGLTGAARRS